MVGRGPQGFCVAKESWGSEGLPATQGGVSGGGTGRTRLDPALLASWRLCRVDSGNARALLQVELTLSSLLLQLEKSRSPSVSPLRSYPLHLWFSQ